MGIKDGGDKTSLSEVRLYRMRVLLSMALDMSEIPHLIIGYLLEDEHGGFEF